MNSGSPIYEFGEFRLDAKEKRLTRLNGEDVTLPPKAFDLLQFLVENPRQLLEKTAILDAVWAESFVEEGNLKINIHLLRKTLGDGLIETVPRRGYRFIAQVDGVGRSEILVERLTEETVTVERVTETRSAAKYVAVAAIAIVVLATVGFFKSGFFNSDTRTAKSATIAVLPLRNLSPNKEDEYLGLGFSDALIAELAELKGLTVRPTSSVLSLTPEQLNAPMIREKLGVDKFVEGTIQRDQGKIRISIQLVNSADGSVVWAEQFDDDESGLLRLQNKITNQIVSSMRAALTPNETDMLARRYTASSQAFDAYLKGRYFWNKRSGDDLKKAIGFFNEAKKKDPNFALAFVGLSDAHQMLSEYSGAERASSIADARANVQKALQLNGEIGEAYCSLAYIQAFYDWDFQAAEASFKRAFELSPNYPTAHQWYGEFLLATGRSDEAYNSLKRARELDPLSPIILTDIVAYYYVTRNFDAAIAEAESVIQIFPKFGFARSIMAMSYLQKGNEIEFYRAAIAADEIYFPPQIVESRRKAYEQGGLSELFKLRYQQSTNPPISLFLNDYQRAISAVEVGDTEAAFAWLEKSVAAKDRWVINLNQDPYWSPLRKDPRFNAILSKINLRPAE